jgi:hypothetical protein
MLYRLSYVGSERACYGIEKRSSVNPGGDSKAGVSRRRSTDTGSRGRECG